jgi:hypothetical protein
MHELKPKYVAVLKQIIKMWKVWKMVRKASLRVFPCKWLNSTEWLFMCIMAF